MSDAKFTYILKEARRSQRYKLSNSFYVFQRRRKLTQSDFFLASIRLFMIDLCISIIYDQITLNIMKGTFFVRNIITRSPCIIAWCDRQLRRLASLQAASDLRNNYSQLKPSRQRPKIRCFNFCMKFPRREIDM